MPGSRRSPVRYASPLRQRGHQIVALPRYIVRSCAIVTERAALMASLAFRSTPMVSIDIDASCFHGLAEALTKLVAEREVQSALQFLHFCPIVLKGDVCTRADFQMYKRGEKAFLVGCNIRYQSWKKASRARRRSLAIANCRSAIDAVPERFLGAHDKSLIQELVNQAAEGLLG